jgi:hypothetical protein
LLRIVLVKIYSFKAGGNNPSFACPDSTNCSRNHPAPTQKPLIRINMGKDSSSVKIMESPEQAQLPIDRLMPPHSQLYNSETCVFCEYFLHYLQQAITDPATEVHLNHLCNA